MEGSTADIDAGTVKLADGQVESVKLAKPVFVLEPSGRYRASADLSIGGGVLGQMNMGQARAQLVATNSENTAEQLHGGYLQRARQRNARIAIAKAVRRESLRRLSRSILPDRSPPWLARLCHSPAEQRVRLISRFRARIFNNLGHADYKLYRRQP